MHIKILQALLICTFLGCCENFSVVFVAYWTSYCPKVTAHCALPINILYYGICSWPNKPDSSISGYYSVSIGYL